MTAQDRPRVKAVLPNRFAMPLPELAPLRVGDVFHALRAGVMDFLKAPEYGLAVASVAIAGALLMRACGAGVIAWGLTLVLALPLVAPFVLSGFYEISARRHRGEAVDLHGLREHIAHERVGQARWVGVTIAVAAMLWSMVAGILWWLTGGGPVGLLMQALWALPVGFMLYAVAAISLPMLHECRLDALTAMLHSHAMVRDNRGIMLVWALLAGGLLALAVWGWFVALVVVVPVLGHAQWHLYRRATRDPS